MKFNKNNFNKKNKKLIKQNLKLNEKKKNPYIYKKKYINTSFNFFFYNKILERNIININKLKMEYRFKYINFNNLYFFKNNTFLKNILKSIIIMSKKLGEFFILSPFFFFSNNLSLNAARYIAIKTKSCYLATYKTGTLSNLKQTIKKIKLGFASSKGKNKFFSLKKLSIFAYKVVTTKKKIYSKTFNRI